MKVIFFAISLTIFLSGCCRWQQDLNNPARPTNLRGWKEFSVGETVVIKGEFVLQKGEAINNGKVIIQITDISPARCELFLEPTYPKTTIKINSISDNKTLCEYTFILGTTGLNVCGHELEWSAIDVTAINFKENWVAFNLRK